MTMYRISGQGVSKDLAGSVSADEAVAELQRQLAEVTAERDAWKRIHDGQQQVYDDIGKNLGANMPFDLVNEVARQRMAEIETLKAEIALLREELLLAQKYPEGEKP